MNINTIQPTTFNGKYTPRTTRLNLPGRNGRMNIEIIGELDTRITSVRYRSGKVEKAFQNKKGFQEERLAKIFEEIDNNLKEGMEFLYEFLKAQRNQTLR